MSVGPSTSREFARKLMQIKAIRLQPQTPFTWASGWKSPIYCDNRLTLSYPELRAFIARNLKELALDFQIPFASVVGVATGGIAHGVLLAEQLNLPFAYVRSAPKSHGTGSQIEGHIPPGPVLVVEDLISTGKSSLEAVDALRLAGHSVHHMLALFSYGFDTADVRFQASKVQVKTMSGYADLIQVAEEENGLSVTDMEELKAWRKQPETWNQHA
ncbi:MAG: orotate phosphoribosyltransferase [Bacteroidetes bacterium]|nr:orotate phosphoribosyltransferase [Bacteroidota bacterium]